MSDITVRGAEEFLALSKRMKAAGQGELRKELNKALKAAVKPLTPKTRAAASRLPQRGGLAALVAKEPQTVQVRTGAATAGVRLVVGKRRGVARQADEGTIRHPVFGRKPFVAQRVRPGWFTETAEDNFTDIQDGVVEVLEDFLGKVAR